MDYINLDYKPSKKDLICEFYLEPNNINIEKAASHVALESSIGTWTDIATMNKRIAKTLKPSVFYINKKKKIIKIAYNENLFEKGNMPEILSSIAGNIFGMSSVKNLRLMDISFPESIVKSFKGPKFGIAGIRKITTIKERPLIGTIVKPKLGLNEKEHAKVAYDAWIGGLDIVKDDENLTSMSFNNFNKRVIETLKLRKKAEKETGKIKIYMPNVTAETNEMIKRAKFVKKHGGRYVMIDILTAGWSALQTLRNAELGLVIHAHRAGHAAFTRNGKHGISMLAIAKAARLIGADQLHIGAIVGKMTGTKHEVKDIGENIEDSIIHDKNIHILEQKWYNIKPTMAVCSGGLHPGGIPPLVKIMGNNIIMQFGGGCHGHPNGTKEGAMAIKQALEAVMSNKSLKNYSKTHKELKTAIDKFGIIR
ncbi:MAG: type III ribulose-bisphosphate carboxylase [Candidatus Nanoarchaeia archaeon]|nr:type III ribulose-bisphosphate carboxylase [Candidatus Nanoarchaeia archaeon]